MVDAANRQIGSCHCHGYKRVVAREHLFTQMAHIGLAILQVLERGVFQRHLVVTVAENRTGTGITKTLDCLDRMQRRIYAMGEVENGCDAGVDGLQPSYPVPGVDVFGPVQLASKKSDRAHVAFERVVCAYATQRGLPDVPMRIDQTGHHDTVRGVNYLTVVRLDAGRYLADFSIFNEYIGLLAFPKLFCGFGQGEDDAVPYKDARISHLSILSRIDLKLRVTQGPSQ